MKNIKKLVFLFIFAFFFIIAGITTSNASYQKLNSIDYEVHINDDGSMNVIENWDIYISKTNTLFKNFTIDNEKFSSISNVKVTDVTEGAQLTNIYEEMYHVTKDCFYALNINDDTFEIAWGVGLDNSSETKQYRIEYTVEDAIGIYNDCAELYWQFIGENFGISAKKITGTIYLPNSVESKDMIKVWGHTQQLNGEIYATDINKVEFDVSDFESGNYVEVRIAMPTNVVNYSGRSYNYSKLTSIVEEEKEWADSANRTRKIEKIVTLAMKFIFAIIYLVVIFILIKKFKKYKRISKKASIIKPTQEIIYYREFPREDASPAEACLLHKKNKFSFNNNEIGNIFSADLLSIYYLGCMDILEEENKDNIKFVLKGNAEKLQQLNNKDEIAVYNFLMEASNNTGNITLKELQKYITSKVSKTVKLGKQIKEDVKEKLYKKSYIDKEMEKQYIKQSNSLICYNIFLVYTIFLSILAFASCNIIHIIIALSIFSLIIACKVYLKKIVKSINVYSQDAIDEIEKWKGLKKFMDDLSLIDKKEVPEVALWEKYLIYATAFGIADKVLEQLKIIYPDFDTQVRINTSTHVNLILGTNISHTISSSVGSSMSSAYSSGTGGGGGFSGGGRRPVEAGGGGGRKIKMNVGFTIGKFAPLHKRSSILDRKRFE
jgi:uncharacterized membrane protein